MSTINLSKSLQLVWERFGQFKERYPNTFKSLRWHHFYAALKWDDAEECLTWASDIGTTVAEMRAWRRAQRGEDLSKPEQEI